MKKAAQTEIEKLNEILSIPSEMDLTDKELNKMSRAASASASLKCHPALIENARKRGLEKKGITLSEAHKKAISASIKTKLSTEEVKQKLSVAKKGKAHSEEHKAAIGAANKGVPRPRPHRRCTVDGITIYASLMELIDVLGAGKAGRRHPDFRYIDEKPKKAKP